MRKLFWCCSAAGMLVVGGMFTVSYYASCNPESAMGHCLTNAANASIVMQPIVGVGTVVAKTIHHFAQSHETAYCPGSVEECIPDDPQPITRERARDVAGVDMTKASIPTPAPIVIPEDDPMPQEESIAPTVIEPPDRPEQEPFENICPIIMPYCTDDDPMPRPTMPYADGEKREESEDVEMNALKAWMELFKGADEPKSTTAPESEELPAPTEEAIPEPNCQEDSHRHEHYPGCPSMICPYTGKSYPSGKADKKYIEQYQKGLWDFEGASEDPLPTPKKHGKKAAPGKGREGKNTCPHTEGVDTMEYRRSDGGLNEYGPGPL